MIILDVQQLSAMIPNVLSIFALAWFAFWPAIPAGLALGLSPAVVIATTTLSYTSGALLVMLVGERAREWVMRKLRRGDPTKSDGRIQQIWKRYGVIGLGLAAPMTVGAQAGAVVGLVLQVKRRRLILWMVLGALAWSIGLTMAVVLGLAGLQSMS